MTTAVAVTAIDLYQQFISPHKGFRCAHRVCHGRPSCSQFAKRLIAKVGLLRFAPLFMRRLKRCGEAARAMKNSWARRSAAKAQRDADDRKRRESRCDLGDACDPGACGDVVPNVSGCDVPSFDIPVDPGACDCASGCDLSL